MSNLSPDQFPNIVEHVGFDRWAKSEISRHHQESQVEPGHYRFDHESGRRVSRLRRAQDILMDTYSDAAHQQIEGYSTNEDALHSLNVPLHETLATHRDLVNEYRQSR
jgi:flagellar hook-associated protein FlgK